MSFRVSTHSLSCFSDVCEFFFNVSTAIQFVIFDSLTLHSPTYDTLKIGGVHDNVIFNFTI